MALNNDYTDYNGTPALNTLPVPQGMPAGSLPSQLYAIIRQLMAALFNTGTELKALYSVASAPLRGLQTSYVNGTTISTAPGAAIDTTGTLVMTLGSTFTKTTAPFVIGSGNGGLDTGTVTVSTGYHMHLISTAAGVTDVLYSLSYTAPTLPTGYTKFVPIGGFYVNSGGNIVQYVQNGSEFLYTTSFADYAAAGSTTALLTTLSVPTGVKVNVLFRAFILQAASGSNLHVLFTSPDESDQAPGSLASLSQFGPAGNAEYGAAGQFNLRTSTSGQIRQRSDIASGYQGVNIFTFGFIYPRGIQ